MQRSRVSGRTVAGLVLSLFTAFTCSTTEADDAIESVVVEAAAIGTAEAAPGQQMAIRVTRGAAGLEVVGRFRVAAPSEVVWDVLTDYEDIDRFVSSMRTSSIAGHGADHVLVHQVAVGRLFLFKREMRTTLRVHEAPGHIRFEDVLHKDFEHYRGEWRIDDRGSEREITYRVEARPNVSIPNFVARGMFERLVRQLLLEVEKEVVRRAALAERLPSERSRQ